MKKLAFGIASIAALAASAAHAEEIKIGVLLGFTGPIESLTPDMAGGAELAIAEVNESGMLLDGSSVMAVRGDSTCIDSAAAVAAAEQLVTADNVNAIVGADCSGVTASVLQNVARPERDRHDFAVRNLPRPFDSRGRRPVLQDSSVRQAARRRHE